MENFGVVSVNLSGAPALIELFLIHGGVGDPFAEAFEDELSFANILEMLVVLS